ncbi:MAG: response regulator transcription factor [Calditrichia bacterium]|nr:response regulator transcription factor [Calditrichia bacterium]
MIKISIVEDDKEIRESLAILIEGTDGFSCISHYGSVELAMKKIEQDSPDVILMDINLPGMSGIEGVKLIKENMPDCEIIMQTISENDKDVFDSLCAGACGFLKKNTPPAKLLDAITEAVNGGAPMNMDIARLVVNSFKPEQSKNNPLTDREKEVLRNLCEGKSYKMIAGDLFVDINTVKFHIRNIYRKLEVNSKGEAIVKAMKEHLT